MSIGRSKAWHTAFSQMVFSGHSSSREQDWPARGALAGSASDFAGARSSAGRDSALGASGTGVACGSSAGASSAWAV
jgi:hypothetical protein